MMLACGESGMEFIEREIPPDYFTVTGMFLVSVPEDSEFASWLRLQDRFDITEVRAV